MKFPPYLLGLALLSTVGAFSALAQQQEAAAQASLTVVNAVPGEKNVFVSFDDESIWPPGFTPGQSTASVLFPAGKKKIKIECEGFASTEAALELPAGANCALIMYPGEVVPEGPDKGKRRIGVFLPSPHKPGSKSPASKAWKIVLVGSAQSREVEVNGKKVSLVPRKSTEFAAPEGAATVKFQGQDIFAAAPEDAGEYWIVVFPNGEALQAVMLNHTPFPIPSA